MDSSLATQNDRCMFLELSVELRTMIYELVKQGNYSFDDSEGQLTIKAATTPRRFGKADRPATLTLTQINRQVRKEYQPIFGRGLWLTIYTGTEEDRTEAQKFVEEASEELINNVNGYCFAPCKRCPEHLMVPINKASSSEVGVVEFCGGIPQFWKDNFVQSLENRVKALPTTENGRRSMTKKSLEGFLKVFFMLSKDYQR